MCGIAGIFNFNGNPVKFDDLLKMNKAIEHRGPDDSGTMLFSDNNSNDIIEFDSENNIICKNTQNENRLNIGFTHRRLSIIDLSYHGHQPMMDISKRIKLVYNGEIYNHRIIRNELESYGFRFKSNTDTEVIIYAYIQYGIDCINKFNGMFAFALWDVIERKMYLVRDRVGIKPLYYSNINGNIYFSSEIKALLQINTYKRKLNKNALSYYFSYLSVPAPYTTFENIYKIQPGSYIVFNSNSTEPQKVKYWYALTEEQEKPDNIEIINETNLMLEKSVERRMMSDVPYGVFLSGGVDSSLIVSMMSKLTDTPVNTFTIGYKGLKEDNEFRFAQQISTIFNTNHKELIIDIDDSKYLIEEMVYYQDEPIADPVCIPILLLSKKAKESGVTVIQVGEGADEIFAGYRNFRTYYKINKYFWNHLHRYPSFVKKIISRTGKGILSKTKFRKYIDYFDFMTEDKELYWNNAHKYYPSDIRKILTYDEFINPYEYIKQIASFYKKKNYKSFLNKLAFQELNLRLPELLLMRVDKMSMAASVECRVPFLDYKLVEYALTIPDSIKMKNNEPKYIIKKIAEKHLPKELIYRRKVGFGFPIKHFFKDGFDNYLKDSIFNSKIKYEDVINYDFVNEMFNLTKYNKVNYHSHLWSLANLCMWYDLWF
jgi:asparagine synthase (glutamine-hydrolysing)